jgi:hypothetical protein
MFVDHQTGKRIGINEKSVIIYIRELSDTVCIVKFSDCPEMFIRGSYNTIVNTMKPPKTVETRRTNAARERMMLEMRSSRYTPPEPETPVTKTKTRQEKLDALFDGLEPKMVPVKIEPSKKKKKSILSDDIVKNYKRSLEF